MNPIFQAIINTVTALSLKRTCPKCIRDQIVPASKKRESVFCKFCGAQIPSPKS